MNVHIRWMIHRDRPEVVAIENASFEFPWREEDFEQCTNVAGCFGRVATVDDKVVGCVVCEFAERKLRVLNLAVLPGYRRRGVGAAMLDYLRHFRRRITLEVRETNVSAQLFFRSQGFRATHILHGFYDETDDDAYVMELAPFERSPCPLLGGRFAQVERGL